MCTLCCQVCFYRLKKHLNPPVWPQRSTLISQISGTVSLFALELQANAGDWKSSAVARVPACLLSSAFWGAAVQICQGDLRGPGEPRDSTPTPFLSRTSICCSVLVGNDAANVTTYRSLVSLIPFFPRRQKAEKGDFCCARQWAVSGLRAFVPSHRSARLFSGNVASLICSWGRKWRVQSSAASRTTTSMLKAWALRDALRGARPDTARVVRARCSYQQQSADLTRC